MQMLYDSDSFVVVHMQANEPAEGEPAPRIVRHGFEIVDKRSNKVVYLDGYSSKLVPPLLQQHGFRLFDGRTLARSDHEVPPFSLLGIHTSRLPVP